MDISLLRDLPKYLYLFSYSFHLFPLFPVFLRFPKLNYLYLNFQFWQLCFWSFRSLVIICFSLFIVSYQFFSLRFRLIFKRFLNLPKNSIIFPFSELFLFPLGSFLHLITMIFLVHIASFLKYLMILGFQFIFKTIFKEGNRTLTSRLM